MWYINFRVFKSRDFKICPFFFPQVCVLEEWQGRRAETYTYKKIRKTDFIFEIFTVEITKIDIIYRYGHNIVSTLEVPPQAHTSGGPIWIILFLLKICQKISECLFWIFVSFGVLAQKLNFWTLWRSSLIFDQFWRVKQLWKGIDM